MANTAAPLIVSTAEPLMAKVTIILRDEPGDMVNLRAEFSPPITDDEESGTPAQAMAVDILKIVTQQLADRAEEAQRE